MDISNSYLKEEFQKWITSKSFSHFITIEPSPGCPILDDEIVQRLRTIEFGLCKKYLPPSFPKFCPNDRFWMIGFYEGNWESRNRHAHILLHTPSFLWGQNIDADFSMEWMMLDSKDPHSRGSRTLKLPYIKKIENRYIGNAAAIYSSKQVGKLPSWEDWFFAT